jgi:hypothetical protein
VHKEYVPEGKTINAEFYKGITNHLLKRIQRVHPAAFCSRDFFLLHDNVPTHKAASVCQFLTQKNVKTLYHCPYSPDLSPPDYFLFPKLKMKLKGLHFADVAEIQEAVTDELKKVQKEEISQLFRNCTTAQEPVYMPMELILGGGMCLPHVSLIFKKISPTTFGLHCVYANLQIWPQAARRNLATTINPRAADWIPKLELLFQLLHATR